MITYIRIPIKNDTIPHSSNTGADTNSKKLSVSVHVYPAISKIEPNIKTIPSPVKSNAQKALHLPYILKYLYGAVIELSLKAHTTANIK